MKKKKKASIRVSYTFYIKLGYILMIALIFCAFGYSIYSGFEQKNTDRLLSTSSLPVIKSAGELEKLAANEQVILSKYFFSRDPLQINALAANENAFEKTLEDIKKLDLSDQEKQFLALLEKEYREAKILNTKIIESVEDNKSSLTPANIEQNYRRSLIRLTQVHSYTNKLANNAYEKYEDKRLQSQIKLNFSLSLNIVASVILFVAALTFFRFMNRLLDILEIKGIKDGLTQLFNKAMLEEFLNMLIAKSKRNNVQFSLIVLDIDFFKKINDTHGHLAGDYILKGIAGILKSSIRLSDFPARFGGEEFAIVFPDTNLESSVKIAERIRIAVEATSFEYEGQSIPVTISIGAAQWQKEFDSAKLFEAADEKLYEAKKSGRNKVCY